MELTGRIVSMRHLHIQSAAIVCFCHSPFDKYKNENVTMDNATGVSCGVCHNIHNMTDSKYAETFSEGIFMQKHGQTFQMRI